MYVWLDGKITHGIAEDAGLAAKIASHRRISNDSLPIQAKAVGNYLNSQLAYREALACGAQEAILLDERGFLAEGSAENIFLVRDRTLYTPTTRNALQGITRDTVIAIAKDLGLVVTETDLTRGDIYTADEAFFTGTASEIKRISSVDGQTIENRAGRLLVDLLRQRYQSVVRAEYLPSNVKTSRSHAWCTSIYKDARVAAEPPVIEVASSIKQHGVPQ